MVDDIRPPKRDGRPKTHIMTNSNIEEIIEVPDENEAVKPAMTPRPPYKHKKSAFERKWLRALHWRHTHLSKPKWFLLWFCLIAALIIASFGIYKIFESFKSPSHVETAKAKPVVVPTTKASRLTGVEVALALDQRPVTGVMIENSKDARPQSGLKDAGVVFEAIAEGGITRFLALYLEAQPDYIGPIRSVRPYYLDFVLPFDGSIAHVGGAPQALSDIKSLGVKDLDQFSNSGAYQRVNNRAAPHNVYSSMAKFDALNASKGFTSSNFTGFVRKKEAPSAQPTARAINIDISSALYDVRYDYDVATNSYKRSQGGAPHSDERSAAQLAPKVVIALVMTRGIASDGQHTNYGTSGSGHMYVFQDGALSEGTWSKASRKDQFSFTDASGQPIALNPGQAWITLVDGGKVTFGP